MKTFRTRMLFAAIFMAVVTLMGCDRQFSNPILNGTENRESPINIGERASGTLYKLGVVLVQYDEKTWEQVDTTDTPITAVNEFFTNKGYTPKVTEVVPDYRVEVVQVDDDVDPLSLLGALNAIPGVTTAELATLHGIFEIATWELREMPSLRNPEFAQIRPVKAGKTEDGRLQRLGAVVVQYDYQTFEAGMDTTVTPIAAVNEFLISKGYTPRTIDIFFTFHVEVIDIGEDIDPSPMLKELKALPGVVDAQRNILYDIFPRLSGNVSIPTPPL